ncbi:interleukin-17C-like [Betta splendens]|uniref:Interleukin-17C-like n=1 Tax=Betta splendens TaxID=158456 RepID=A0A6P7M555_BETSP|nr:interleukin-17C-like [Betta splendens]
MTRAVLQTVFVGALLLLGERTSAAGGKRRCINSSQLDRRVRQYYEYWNATSISKVLAQDARTCAQAATDMQGNVERRSLSPWKHYIDHDVNRIPPKISFAKCLCRGCILRKKEQNDYNSVTVFSELMVLKKTPCPSDPQQYVVRKGYIQVPVACTCVVPKYVK